MPASDWPLYTMQAKSGLASDETRHCCDLPVGLSRYSQRLLLFVPSYYRDSLFSSPDRIILPFSTIFSLPRDRQSSHCAAQTPCIVVLLSTHAKLSLELAFYANPFGFYYVHILLQSSQAFLGLHCLLLQQPPYAEIGSRDYSTISSISLIS